jgi:chromate transporter
MRASWHFFSIYATMLRRKGGDVLKKDKAFYLKLFTSTFYLSAFTFGGGYVIIPLMRKKFVEELGWVEEEEMMDLTAIAQASPGAIAVNASILIGYRVAGIVGALTTVLGTVLPPLFILAVVSLMYSAFRDNIIVNFVLRGMQAGVVAVILDVVLTMSKEIFKEKKVLPIILLMGSFISVYFFHVSMVLVILICGLIGVLSIYAGDKKGETDGEKRACK